jgi:lycopene cyclase domain-containing protein
MYTYLLLNLFTISFPLIRSFESRINYFSKWGYIIVAIIVTGFIFIIWDHIFTELGIWSFNKNYIIGYYILSLPIEEWLFFITVPFACLFIYEVLKYFIKNNPLERLSRQITYFLIPFFFIIAAFNIDKTYTLVNFFFCGSFLLLHYLVFKNKYLGLFYLSYLVHLVPFTLVNGALTYLPVVEYNNTENLGIRAFTIPIEDFGYSFLLLLMNASIYEFTRERFPEFTFKLKTSKV